MAPDGTETAEEVLRGGKRVKTALFYLAGEPQPEGLPREKPALIVAFLRARGEAPRFCCDGNAGLTARS